MTEIINSRDFASLRWLIVGADGLLGGRMLNHLSSCGAAASGTSRRKGSSLVSLDLTQDLTLWQAPPCDVVVLCAAASRIAECETDPSGTERINVEAPLLLARKFWDQGSFVVFVSSSAVFDGCADLPNTETPLCPTNAYGKPKAHAETLLRAEVRGDRLAIIRPTKLLARETPRLAEWENALRAGGTIAPSASLVMAPLHIDDASSAILAIAAVRVGGNWHLSGREDISYADFAKAWAGALGLATSGIRPQSDDATPPQRARLDMTTTTKRFDIAAPTVAATVAALARESR